MIKFTVPGLPIAKGRPRFTTRGKFAVAYTPQKTKDAEKSIADYAKYFMGFAKPLHGPLALDLIFYMPIPKSVSKTNRRRLNGSYHVSKPDADNLAKLVSDALNGICYLDDSQISKLTITKIYALDPGVTINISEIDN